MDFGGGSDQFILVAWNAGLVVFAITIALSLQVLIMRQRNARREHQREAAVATWRPLLFEALLGGAPALPAVAQRDEETFLLLWNQIQDGVRGETRARLNRLAEAAGADDMARRRLDRDDALARVLALHTLGYLGREGDYAQVIRYLNDARIYLALAAARALVHIDPKRAADDVLAQLAVRQDWPIALFATVLAQVDTRQLTEKFCRLYRELSSEPLIRLLRLTPLLIEDATETILESLLTSSGDPEILIAALKQVRRRSLLHHVRRACKHESWAVRTQAAAALGRIGGPAERNLLLRLLTDSQWWVRYRAAQALISGHFGPVAEVTERAALLGDRFAADILEHALAEQRS